MKIYYNPKRKALSRELRKKSTLSEVLLWKIVKGKKIKGYLITINENYKLYHIDRLLLKNYYIVYVKASLFSNESLARLHISAKVILSNTSVMAFRTSIITLRITQVTSSENGL